MRLADPRPAFCASCFSQKPEVAHVDFEAAYDGPVINTDGLKQVVDDLIICRECMETAGRVLDLDGLQGEVDRLTERLETSERERMEAEKYASKLEDAMSRRPQRDLKRGPGRPPRQPVAA